MNFYYFDADSFPNSSFFSGYAFWKEHYVSEDHGQQGLPSGLNGAYVSCRLTEYQATFGVDWSGAGRWFYYTSPNRKGFWAVSNSLVLIAERLSEKNIFPTLDVDELKMWGYRGAFVEQMTSLNTIFKEVKIASRWHDIAVDLSDTAKSGGETVLRLTPREQLYQTAPTYPQALKQHLDETLRCLRSFLDAGVKLNFDLSGGLDSRTAFSFASYLLKCNPNYAPLIHIYSSPSAAHQLDLKIATKIASNVGLTINTSRKNKYQKPASEEDLRNWELNRLGQYILATKVPIKRPMTEAIHVSGAGGENYRPFYKKWGRNVASLLYRRKHFLINPLSNMRFQVKKINQCIAGFREFYPSAVDDLTIHYREFRGRFHIGIPATEHTMFFPLSNKTMDILANSSPKDYFQTRQLYFDIISNLAPELLGIEFDTPQKSPTKENLRNVTTVTLENHVNRYEICDFVLDQFKESPTNRKLNVNQELGSRALKWRMQLPSDLKVKEYFFLKKTKMIVEKSTLPRQSDMQSIQYVYLASHALKHSKIGAQKRISTYDKYVLMLSYHAHSLPYVAKFFLIRDLTSEIILRYAARLRR